MAEGGVGAPAVLVTGEHEAHWASEEFVATPGSDERSEVLAFLGEWDLPIDMFGVVGAEVFRRG